MTTCNKIMLVNNMQVKNVFMSIFTTSDIKSDFVDLQDVADIPPLRKKSANKGQLLEILT